MVDDQMHTFAEGSHCKYSREYALVVTVHESVREKTD